MSFLKGRIDGFLTVEDGTYTIVTDNKSSVKFDQTSFQAALTQVNISKTAQRLNLSAADVQELLSPAKFTMKTQTSSGQNQQEILRLGQILLLVQLLRF